jgi:glutamate carboxypeptidase
MPDISRHLSSQLPAALEMLRVMVGINSFTGNPEGVNRLARYTADCFAPLGFTAEYVPSYNPAWGNHLVLSRPGASARSIAMISHLDTVFPPEEEERNNFRWLVEGDRVFGPGTQDIKGGTVMMWQVLSALQTCAPQVFDNIHWRLFLNSSEETYSPDFGEVCRARFGPQCLAALVFEGEGRVAGERKLVVARKGRATWRVRVRGRAAHAGGSHRRGANSLVQLAQTLDRIAGLTDYSRNLTFNVGVARGGTVLNRVPHEAVAEGEFRAFDPEVYEAAKRAFLALAGPGAVRSAADHFACEVSCEILTESRPWPRNPGTDRLFAIWKHTADDLGSPTGAEERGGLSDGNLVWDVVPTIDGLGPWGDNDHCSERSADGAKVPEFLGISSVVPKAMLNTHAVIRLAECRGQD